jgi:hypothetical protein
VPRRQPETCRRAVIEHIDRKAIEADDFREPVDDPRDMVECVSKRAAIRHIGLTKPGKIGRDEVKPIREKRDEVAEHMAGARKTVQQQDRRGVFRARLTIEDVEPVDVDLPETDLRHLRPLRWGNQAAKLATASRITSMTGSGAVTNGV